MLKPCLQPGCPNLTEATPARCTQHRRAYERERLARNPRRAEYQTTEYRRNRAIVLQRDGYVCRLRLPGCMGLATTVDHLRPLSAGGTNELTNLVASCLPCNSGKGDRGR